VLFKTLLFLFGLLLLHHLVELKHGEKQLNTIRHCLLTMVMIIRGNEDKNEKEIDNRFSCHIGFDTHRL
jgi:calcineurin-like phosphoesterase family protein